MSFQEYMLIGGVISPLVAFVILAFFGSRLGKPAASYVAILGILISTGLAIATFVSWTGLSGDQQAALTRAARDHAFHWANLGTIPVTIGVNLDSLTVIMYLMVTFVSACIFVFSTGYMAGHSDEVDGKSKYHRFFTYLSLFAFSMLGLVISSSILFLFIFWELVGLCSYLLIGFYFHKKSASNAAIKAFVTNRVGDFGFLIGLMMVVGFLKDLSLVGAAEAFADQHASFVAGNAGDAPLFAMTFFGQSLATWMGIGLFCGAIGKSAQVPLQVWLPDAMEGPTPVSALIHAATMVAAGVYLVSRIFLLLTPEAQFVIACIGCITLAMAALIAIVQTDIKRVLAYSTLSQLGYMIFGMGIGAWTAALFHLLTHAFFKAMMFLCSGQVIEGCHHEQDIRKMGGLLRKMPVTGYTFLIGVLAIAGVGIPGTGVGIGGFFSKDEILAVAHVRTHAEGDAGGHHDDPHGEPAEGEHRTAGRPPTVAVPVRLAAHAEERPGEHAAEGTHQADDGHHAGPVAAKLPAVFFWVPTIIAYVTAFYMMRCWWLTFMGKPRDEHVYDHAHEMPLMYLPLAVLAIGTVVCGYVWFRPLVSQSDPGGFLVPTFDGHAHTPAMEAAHHGLVTAVGFAFVIGFGLAIAIYRGGLEVGEKLKNTFKPIYIVLDHKFFFDEIYGFFLVSGTVMVAHLCRLWDRLVVDGLVNLSALITERIGALSGNILDAKGIDGAVNGLARGGWNLAGTIRGPQNGSIRNYVLFATGSAAAVVLVILIVS